MQTVRTRQ